MYFTLALFSHRINISNYSKSRILHIKLNIILYNEYDYYITFHNIDIKSIKYSQKLEMSQMTYGNYMIINFG